MAIKFFPADVNEHELGAYLGSLDSTSKKPGSFELYFPDQDSYLNLVDNQLFLDDNWQFDFETKYLFNMNDRENIPFYDFSNSETPIKFVYLDLDYDWMYAPIKFVDVDEGPLTFQGWESPWSPIADTVKSGVPYIDALLPDEPIRWNSDTFYDENFSKNESTVLTFSFPSISNEEPKFIQDYDDWKTEDVNVFPFNEDQMEAVRLVLTEWSKVANLTFLEVEEKSGEVGELRFAFTDAPEITEFWGWAGYPSTHPSSGDVWVEASHRFEQQWERSTAYNFSALIHETGHALGLDHPHEGSDKLQVSEDFTHYTLMSYNDVDQAYYTGETGQDWDYVISYSPMVYDIAAMQYLYGPTDHNSENTVYNVDFSKPFVQSIWDSAGNDTLDLGTSTYECLINLEPGSYSTIPCYNWSMPDNLGIAFGAVIENAIGGLKNDIIFGNSEDNFLDGGSGDDILRGGAGNDVFDWNDAKRSGKDEFYGEEGDDVFVVDNPSDSVIEIANEGSDLVWVGIDRYNLPSNVERVSSLLEKTVTLFGNILDNEIRGNDGSDFLNGVEGNDIIFGGSGNDTITGGTGDDILYGENGFDNFIFFPGFGNDVISDFNEDEDTIFYEGVTINEVPNAQQSLSEDGSKVISFLDGSTITFKALDLSKISSIEEDIDQASVFQPEGLKLDFGNNEFSVYRGSDETIKIFSLIIPNYYISLTDTKGKAWSSATPIGVEATSTGYNLITETVGKKGSTFSEYTVTSDGVVSKKGAKLKADEIVALEVSYTTDLNQDGQILNSLSNVDII